MDDWLETGPDWERTGRTGRGLGEDWGTGGTGEMGMSEQAMIS